jgi:hypothetical protein
LLAEFAFGSDGVDHELAVHAVVAVPAIVLAVDVVGGDSSLDAHPVAHGVIADAHFGPAGAAVSVMAGNDSACKPFYITLLQNERAMASPPRWRLKFAGAEGNPGFASLNAGYAC